MPNRLPRFLTALCLGLLLAAAAAAQQDTAANTTLSRQAYLVLRKNCYKCHGGARRESFDVLKHEELLAAPYYVVAKDLDKSQLWTRAGVHFDMPPRGETERPTAEEIDVLRRWILSGAERFPPEQSRDKQLDEAYILSEIHGHLTRSALEDRRHLRYFTLTHLYNNPNVTDDELRIYRAALSKTINSLSRKREIVLPEAVDKVETIYSLDLRRVGWDDRVRWLEVLKAYPYGLEWRDDKLAKLVRQIQALWSENRLQADQVTYLRADWFVAMASRSPVYDALLQLPGTEKELQTQLGVDFSGDFFRGDLSRAVVTQSGVSRHNRLIDRHEGTATAYYYKSFDFGKGNGRSILALHPLGPAFERNPFPQESFEEDGGEIVFSLPNGLQGYMIVDTQGIRIPIAPIGVVRDLNEISGSPLVVNGISCMGCHTRGIKRYEDNLGRGFNLGGQAGQKVAQLFKPNDKQASHQREDSDRFLVAATKATGPFLLVKADQTKQITDFPEPISALAQHYQGAVSLETAACELGETIADLQKNIPRNRDLQAQGLGPMAAGFRVAREFWESRPDRGDSVFQKTAKALGKGNAISNQ